ncbi:chitinase-like protein 4 [Mesocricetus auratus]|uniref:Chitinase-like protein 4 n=1 Tax=Mesocricetus auratus TaxID=10036 RepID=A0ABM2XZF4_MESAU|nr:chitinase-like protein 4 [Mesocricetus auratus]
MNYWKNHGADPEKVIVGFPAYGHTYTLSDPSNNGIGAPTIGAGPPGKYTSKTGLWAYYEAHSLKQNNFGDAMVWLLDIDDFTGSFCKHLNFLLTTTLKDNLNDQSQSCKASDREEL